MQRYLFLLLQPHNQRKNMQYYTYDLSNGLKIIHLPCDSPVSYCGFAINAGTREEEEDAFGMAHFVEHMLFKGTHKRKVWHILNRMETVGGELNAYTTKEETFVYSIFLEQHFERAFELLSDLIFHSCFPEQEAKKELEVIIDEINAYEDNPSELIYDDFENILFEGHPMGHHILGTSKSLESFSGQRGLRFTQQYYLPSNMVFFSMGKTDFRKITRLAEKFVGSIPGKSHSSVRQPAFPIKSCYLKQNKNTAQSHVMIGGRAYNMHDDKKAGLYLINNILGGPGMNSRLNLILREKHGLVYQVDSSYTPYSDTGVFSIYFGAEKEDSEKCTKLIFKELKKLQESPLTTSQLDTAKKQMIGQLAVANEHKENTFLGLGKSFLHFNRYESLPDVYAKIQAISATSLQDICNEIFDEKNVFFLEFR